MSRHAAHGGHRRVAGGMSLVPRSSGCCIRDPSFSDHNRCFFYEQLRVWALLELFVPAPVSFWVCMAHDIGLVYFYERTLLIFIHVIVPGCVLYIVSCVCPVSPLPRQLI